MCVLFFSFPRSYSGWHLGGAARGAGDHCQARGESSRVRAQLLLAARPVGHLALHHHQRGLRWQNISASKTLGTLIWARRLPFNRDPISTNWATGLTTKNGAKNLHGSRNLQSVLHSWPLYNCNNLLTVMRAASQHDCNVLEVSNINNPHFSVQHYVPSGVALHPLYWHYPLHWWGLLVQ